jgi:hypothetical protein
MRLSWLYAHERIAFDASSLQILLYELRDRCSYFFLSTLRNTKKLVNRKQDSFACYKKMKVHLACTLYSVKMKYPFCTTYSFNSVTLPILPHLSCPICRRPDLNRYGSHLPQDFKSCASADSATPAHINDMYLILIVLVLILHRIAISSFRNF